MGILQFTSIVPKSGKTSIAAALALSLTKAGKTPGYYKPVAGTGDADAAFILSDVVGATGAAEGPAPLGAIAGSVLSDDQARRLKEATAGLESAHGVVLLEGPSGNPGLAASISAATGCKTVLVVKPSGAADAGDILQAAESLGECLTGVIANGVPKHRLSGLRNVLYPALESRGVPLLGVIPELRAMHAPTVDQLADTLGASWVQEPEDAGVLLERFLIGGNIMDSGEEYYGRYPSQAVITRSQRTDIQLACLLHGTKCLVLTEGGEPAGYIKAEAMQRGVPVMVVESNTMETADALGSLLSSPSTLTVARVSAFAESLPNFLDLDWLKSLAG